MNTGTVYDSDGEEIFPPEIAYKDVPYPEEEDVIDLIGPGEYNYDDDGKKLSIMAARSRKQKLIDELREDHYRNSVERVKKQQEKYDLYKNRSKRSQVSNRPSVRTMDMRRPARIRSNVGSEDLPVSTKTSRTAGTPKESRVEPEEKDETRPVKTPVLPARGNFTPSVRRDPAPTKTVPRKTVRIQEPSDEEPSDEEPVKQAVVRKSVTRPKTTTKTTLKPASSTVRKTVKKPEPDQEEPEPVIKKPSVSRKTTKKQLVYEEEIPVSKYEEKPEKQSTVIRRRTVSREKEEEDPEELEIQNEVQLTNIPMTRNGSLIMTKPEETVTKKPTRNERYTEGFTDEEKRKFNRMTNVRQQVTSMSRAKAIHDAEERKFENARKTILSQRNKEQKEPPKGPTTLARTARTVKDTKPEEDFKTAGTARTSRTSRTVNITKKPEKTEETDETEEPKTVRRKQPVSLTVKRSPEKKADPYAHLKEGLTDEELKKFDRMANVNQSVQGTITKRQAEEFEKQRIKRLEDLRETILRHRPKEQEEPVRSVKPSGTVTRTIVPVRGSYGSPSESTRASKVAKVVETAAPEEEETSENAVVSTDEPKRENVVEGVPETPPSRELTESEFKALMTGMNRKQRDKFQRLARRAFQVNKNDPTEHLRKKNEFLYKIRENIVNPGAKETEQQVDTKPQEHKEEPVPKVEEKETEETEETEETKEVSQKPKTLQKTARKTVQKTVRKKPEMILLEPASPVSNFDPEDIEDNGPAKVVTPARNKRDQEVLDKELNAPKEELIESWGTQKPIKVTKPVKPSVRTVSKNEQVTKVRARKLPVPRFEETQVDSDDHFSPEERADYEDLLLRYAPEDEPVLTEEFPPDVKARMEQALYKTLQEKRGVERMNIKPTKQEIEYAQKEERWADLEKMGKIRDRLETGELDPDERRVLQDKYEKLAQKLNIGQKDKIRGTYAGPILELDLDFFEKEWVVAKEFESKMTYTKGVLDEARQVFHKRTTCGTTLRRELGPDEIASKKDNWYKAVLRLNREKLNLISSSPARQKGVMKALGCIVNNVLFDKNGEINFEILHEFLPNARPVGREFHDKITLFRVSLGPYHEREEKEGIDMYPNFTIKGFNYRRVAHAAFMERHAAVMCTNKLRPLCPNFKYLITTMSCTPAITSPTGLKMNSWCDRESTRYHYLVYDGNDHESLLQDLYESGDMTPIFFTEIFFQVCYALNIAHQKFDFTHYSATCKNVYFTTISARNKYQTAILKYGDTHLKVTAIATLAGSNRSHYTVDGKTYGSNISRWFVKENRSYPLYDVFSFLVSNYIEASKNPDKRNNPRTIKLIKRMFEFFSNVPIDEYISRCGDDDIAVALPYREDLAKYSTLDFVNYVRNGLAVGESLFVSKSDYKTSIRTPTDIAKATETETLTSLNSELGIVKQIRLDSIFTFYWLYKMNEKSLSMMDKKLLLDFYVKDLKKHTISLYKEFQLETPNFMYKVKTVQGYIKRGEVTSVEKYKDLLKMLADMYSFLSRINYAFNILELIHKYGKEKMSSVASEIGVLQVHLEYEVYRPLLNEVYEKFYERYFYPESNEIYYVIGLFEEEPEDISELL